MSVPLLLSFLHLLCGYLDTDTSFLWFLGISLAAYILPRNNKKKLLSYKETRSKSNLPDKLGKMVKENIGTGDRCLIN